MAMGANQGQHVGQQEDHQAADAGLEWKPKPSVRSPPENAKQQSEGQSKGDQDTQGDQGPTFASAHFIPHEDEQYTEEKAEDRTRGLIQVPEHKPIAIQQIQQPANDQEPTQAH